MGGRSLIPSKRLGHDIILVRIIIVAEDPIVVISFPSPKTESSFLRMRRHIKKDVIVIVSNLQKAASDSLTMVSLMTYLLKVII